MSKECNRKDFGIILSTKKHKGSSIEKYLKQQAKNNKFICWKFPATHLNGVPDRILIGNGHTVFIELKRPGEKPRKLQEFRIKQIRKAGGHARVIDSYTGIDALLNELKER